MELKKLKELSQAIDYIIDSYKCFSYKTVKGKFCFYDVDKLNMIKDIAKNLKKQIIENTLDNYSGDKNNFIGNILYKGIKTLLSNKLKQIYVVSGEITENKKITNIKQYDSFNIEKLNKIKSSMLQKSSIKINENIRNIGRTKEDTFLSTMIDKLKEKPENIQNTAIRFLTPDINKDKYFEQLKTMVEKNKNTNNPILLVPYSANEHFVTLIIDTATFPNKNSCKYFDSSNAFDRSGFFNSLINIFSPEDFSKTLITAMGNSTKPINKNIQGNEGTCSFYTEAFLMLMDEKLQDPEKRNLKQISKIVSNKEFIKELQERKEQYFQDYFKEIIKEEEIKQKYENEKIKVEKKYENEKIKLLKKKGELESLEKKRKEELESLEQEKEKELESLEQKKKEERKSLETEMETELKNIMKQIEESQQTVQTTAQQTQDKESITQTQKPMPDQVLQSTQDPASQQTQDLTPQPVQNPTPQQIQNQNQIQNTPENLSEDLGSAINDLIEQGQKQEQSI